MNRQGHVESSNTMSPNISVGDALCLAMAFESRAHHSYRRLAERVHPEVRPLVVELAEQEQKHYELLRDLSVDSDLKPVLDESHSAPPTQERFHAYVNAADLPASASEDDILNYVESRERIAAEHYGYLAELTPRGPLRDLFSVLHDEERRHEADIQARWAKTFSIF